MPLLLPKKFKFSLELDDRQSRTGRSQSISWSYRGIVSWLTAVASHPSRAGHRDHFSKDLAAIPAKCMKFRKRAKESSLAIKIDKTV